MGAVRSPLLRTALTAFAAALALTGCTASTAGHGSLAQPPGTRTAPRSSAAPTSGASAPAPGAARADFRDCSSNYRLSALTFPPGRRAHLSFDCATVAVPLNYADPAGRTITLALLRVHDDRDTAPLGSLLINPGGPGVSGLLTALDLSTSIADTVLHHFDLVGFDPRGVGTSTPISCLTDAQKDALNADSPDVRTAAGFADAKRTAAMVARLCTSTYGSALAQFDTVQTAKDLDRIRQAVGDSRMNYLGFSYGTELGAQYAHLYPRRIRVMVLDGAVDPLTSDIAASTDQLQGFEDAFDQFAAWCTQHTPCKAIGDPREAVYNVAASARRSPIPSRATGETRKATSSLVYTGVLSALYSQAQWPALGAALKEAQGGDSQGLLALADSYNERYAGHYTNVADANLTIECNDSKPGPSDATIRATTASWTKRFPMFGLWSAPSLFSCQQWQPQRTVPPLPTARTAAHAVLVIGNVHDPATPYQGAKDLASTLGDARLLSWNGEGHTSYLNGSSCVDNAVNTYLVTAALPRTGTLCPR